MTYHRNRFLDQVLALGCQSSEALWPRNLLGMLRDEMNGVQLPTVREDDWKYSSLAQLDDWNFSADKSCDLSLLDKMGVLSAGSLVFVGGRFSRELTELPSGVDVLTGAEALGDLSADERQALLKVYPNEAPALSSLNALRMDLPLLLKVSAPSAAVDILHYYPASFSARFSFPRLIVKVPESRELRLSETFFSDAAQTYTGNIMDVFLARNAALEMLRSNLQLSSSVQISSCRVHQEAASRSKAFYFTRGGRLVRDNYTVMIHGGGADAVLNGLHHLAGSSHADSHTSVDHQAPSTTSNQLYKTILNDESRSVFNGKIFVRREAQLTNSYQLNKNLLLSREARADTKPQLEIMADNVKCTHGATVGQLNREELFYLLSRGIGHGEALGMLLEGFIADVVGRIDDPGLRRRLELLMNLSNGVA